MFKHFTKVLTHNVLILLLISTEIKCDYDQQPKIHIKGGSLILEAAYDRNISVRLSRESSLYLNNVDVMEKIRQRYTPTTSSGETKHLDVLTAEQIKEQVQTLHDDLELFANRLITTVNRTRRFLHVRAIRRNLGRIRVLNSRYMSLERLLLKDECAEVREPCKNGGTCFDSYKDFHCECTEGYTGKTCEEDIDECYMLAGTDLGCQNNAQCTNTPGSYKCMCAKGFTGTHCRLRHAICQQDHSQELCGHGFCVPANNQQGYTCICEQGWQQNTIRTNNSDVAPLTCDVDVNECDTATNPCHSECINLPGSFKCGPCPGGYTGSGLTCYDIDECAVDNGGCSLLPKVRCINTEGSYRCGNCPPGWLGNGHVCELAPSNSCDAEKICHPQAKCEFISDTASCTCPPGMFGHGFGPQGCHTNPTTDSCENHICQNNGTCLSVGRRTVCVCPLGYSGAMCETADGCHPNPCENDGVCKPQDNRTFKCSCPPGTTGKRCEVLRTVCSKTMHRPTGELKYPTDDNLEYSINERCAWIIRTNPMEILNLTFTSFDVEDSAECSRDWLQIHDGSGLAYQLIGRFCGKDLPLGGSILSSHSVLFFWFRSDNATNRAGFQMSWVSQPYVCGGKLELSYRESGVIKSPGYPGKTPMNRECEWQLSAPYGYRFVIRIYEIVLGTRPNCTGDTLKIYDADLLLKEHCETSSPEPLRSSSNTLMFKLHTDSFSADSSFQLHYEVEPGVPHCGGIYTEPSSLIVGPTDQATCLYLIQQPPGTQIKWEFMDMKPFLLKNCNLKRIEIFDGKSDEDKTLFITCSGDIVEPIISTSNYMLIRYTNALKDEKDKTPFRAKYSRVCEFRFFGRLFDAGVLTTPNYPKPYLEYITCTFYIYGPANSVVLANFTDISIAETKIFDPIETDGGNSNNLTTVSNLNDDSVSYMDVFLSKTNKRRYLKGSTMELRSERNEMIIVFHATTNTEKARGLRVEYVFENLSCGGVYTENEGSFNKFVPVVQECVWILEAPENKHIQLVLDYAPLNENTQLLVIANTTGGVDYTLVNVTSKTHLEQIFNFNVITIIAHNFMYRLGFSYVFQNAAEFCSGNFSTISGVIRSPYFPRPYRSNLDCVWIITAPLGKKIELKVQNFSLEPTCSGDFLEIRNGKFATSPLIGRYCGNEIPSRIPSFTNNLYLRFISDSSVEGSGFHLSWDQTTTGCGGKLTSYEGSIHSPHYDNLLEYTKNINMELTCDWQINVAQGSSIDLNITISIDQLDFCRKNSLRIYDGSNTLSPKLFFNCTGMAKRQQLQLKSATNKVLIIYTLIGNAQNFSPDFILDYATNCNAIMSDYRGVIESPNFPNYYPENQNCVWDIKGGSNNKLKLAFSHLNLEVENMECKFDYVEVWDMKDDDVLKKTQLCAQLPDPIISEGNHLRIRFVTDYLNNRNGFRAEYSLLGCGEHLEKDFDHITSPSFPYSNDMDCDWYIEVSAGKQIYLTIVEFHLEADNPDCSRDMLLVKETKSSSMELMKECQMQQIPLTITSPSNRLYLHFHTSPMRSRKYFKALYYTKEATCGATFRGSSGVIASPNYPYSSNAENYNCVWDIAVPDSYGIVFDFKDFQLPDSKNCTDASLKFSKLTGMTEIYVDKFCGSEKPSLKQIHGSRSKIVYKNTVAKGLGKFFIEFRKQCGGLITQPTGYIKSLANEECVWEFDVSEGTSISLNILRMECYCKKTKEGLKVCKNGLGYKENEFEDDSIGAGNYTTFFCEEHQSNMFFEVNKLQVFAKNINFQARYSTAQHSCGGLLTSPRGSLVSPNFPGTYPTNIECTWTIQATSGSFIQVQFDSIDIAKSEHCNEDYLEIREWSESKVLGLYCDKQLPDDIILSYERLWLKFHSSDGSIGNGFKLSWSVAHLNEIVNMTKGIIEAPPFKLVENEEEPFAWRIMVQRGQYILVEFENYNSGLNLYDGFDDTALLVDISPSPWRFVSSSNVVFLNTDNANFDYFKIRWNITSEMDIANNNTLASCHSEQFINVHHYNGLRIVSPGYPQGYDNNVHCDWIFKPLNPTEHVVVDLFRVDLEKSSGCSADYLKISTSTDLENWHKQEQICNGSGSGTVSNRYQYGFEKSFLRIHGTPHIKLDFVTDPSINGTGFYAKVLVKCGSNMTDSVGFISGRMFSDFYDVVNTQCIWHINVKPGKRIIVQLDYPQPTLRMNDLVTDCQSYALIYDGLDEHAPLLGPGKICDKQNVTTIKMNSTNNHVTIKYNLYSAFPESSRYTWWNLTYREYSECSEEIRLIPEASVVNITSPQYPNVPHPHTDCEWRIVAPQGEIIQVEFLERFDMNAIYCAKEYLELFDGSTMLARSLGRYCRKPSKTIKTTQNILYMHYLTDINEPRNGFKARISISRCGSSLSGNNGVIKSPDYPGTYPSSSECDYAINLPARAQIRIEIKDIHLPYDMKALSTSDYLEIITIGGDELSPIPIYIYGNATKGTQYQIASNKAVIRFHTFMKRTQYRGFILKYSSNIYYCKHHITGVSGSIPMTLLSRLHFFNTCTWEIRVPKKQRVRLEFQNMNDIKDHNISSLLSFSLYNNLDLTSKIISFTPNTFDSNVILQSTDNIMLVRVTVPRGEVKFKTLRAQYTSTEESPCPADIDDNNPSGVIDIQDTQPTFNGSYYCGIKIKLSGEETLVFNISTVLKLSSIFQKFNTPVVFSDAYNKIPIRTNLTHLIRGQSQTTGSIGIVQNENAHILSLQLSYRKYACGGVVRVKDGMIIEQPQMPGGLNNGPIVFVWTLVKSYTSYTGDRSQDFKLFGNFTFAESCDSESLRIFNGAWDDKEPRVKACKEDKESEIILTSPKTFVVYSAESYNPRKSQFTMTVKKSINCGSDITVHVVSSTIQIDKSLYLNNQECSWIFNSQAGFYLQLQFQNRFFIENSPNCTKDYLEVQRYDVGLWIPEARFCGREVPALYNISSNRIQVIFRTDEAVTGDGFTFVVRAHCTLTINVTSNEPQRIVSPHPNIFGWRGQHCEYIFIGNSSEKLINVRTQFEANHYVYTDNSCRLGSLSIFKQDDNGVEKEGIKHCEMEFEERAYKYLRLAYDSILGSKFTIEYSYDSCGGNVTTPTTIRPQRHETENRYADNMNCLWYITAPTEHSIAVRFKYFDTEEIYDHVSIYSGHLIKPEKRIAKLSGNHSRNTPTIVVEHNQAVINSISDVSNSAKGFEAKITFIANCNERISLSDGNSPVTLVRNFKFNLGEEYICNYRLSAPKGYRIKVVVKKLQINTFNSTCQNSQSVCTDNCNYMEILDSASGPQASIGKFCTSLGSQNRTIISSYEHAVLNLNAKTPGQYSFEIILNMEKTTCGDLSDYTLGDNEIYTLTFPRNGALSYAANTHCTWHLTFNHDIEMHFNYIDLQNASQVTGKCIDYLQIKGAHSSNFLCGQANNYTLYFIYKSYADITFHSDYLVEGKGFELQVQRSGACNRNYTALSNNILYTAYDKEREICNDTIIVPENYTLNFYTSSLYFKNFDRNKTHLKVTDLKTNKIWLNQFQNSYLNKNVFTTSNAVRIEAGEFSTIAFTYTASDRSLPPGCGGQLYTSGGHFSSPSYENNRNFSECRWDIVVPSPNYVKLFFNEFDMGASTNCYLDNVKIVEVLPNNSEKLLKTLCGSDLPETLSSSTNHVAIISKKSPNFNGVGWAVNYNAEDNYKIETNTLIVA